MDLHYRIGGSHCRLINGVNMRNFIFTDDKELNETKEAGSFKKAVKDFQRSYKGHSVRIQYTNKAGNAIDSWIKLPIGRKKRGIGVPEPFMTAKMKKKEEEKKNKGYGR
tara:strand:- start:143 stop:469 length:327 start_codon:yes stop_codon:yes gene_type:complete